jgi:hypothetical protein
VIAFIESEGLLASPRPDFRPRMGSCTSQASAPPFPSAAFTQAECWQALQRANRPQITPRTRAILQGILNHDNGIERRSLALDSLDESFDLDPDTLHRRFVKHAPALARRRAPRARRCGLEAREIDAVIVSTCTGTCARDSRAMFPRRSE